MLSSDIVHVFVVGIFLVDITVAATVPSQGGTPCADHISNCQDFKGWGCGGQYQQWAHMKCAKTCGYCDNNGGGSSPYTTPAPVTGQTNVCLFKGKTYQEGETWADGWEYNCTCVDGSQGFYRCKRTMSAMAAAPGV